VQLIDTKTNNTTEHNDAQTAMAALGADYLWRIACIGGSDEHLQAWHNQYDPNGQPDYVLVGE